MTLSGLSTHVRIPVGCRCQDVALGALPQAWIKPRTLLDHSEPTDSHVSGVVRMAGC